MSEHPLQTEHHNSITHQGLLDLSHAPRQYVSYHIPAHSVAGLYLLHGAMSPQQSPDNVSDLLASPIRRASWHTGLSVGTQLQPGYGADHARSAGNKEFYAPHTLDVLSDGIGEFLRRSQLTIDSLIIEGTSRGAHYNLMLWDRGIVPYAAIVQCGPQDITRSYEGDKRQQMINRLTVGSSTITPGQEVQIRALLRERSPFVILADGNLEVVKQIQRVPRRVLILHGDADTDVGIEHSYALQKYLQTYSDTCRVELEVFAGAGHSIADTHRQVLKERKKAFIDACIDDVRTIDGRRDSS